MKLKILFIPLYILLYVCTISCENKNNDANRWERDPNKPVVLSSFYPETGRIAEKMLLDGDNFGTDPSKIKVYVAQKRASVISSTGKRIYALCPRMPGDECDVSVVVGDDSLVYDRKFTYHVSVSVSTVTGNGTTSFSAGSLAEATLRPLHLVVDDEGNIFAALKDSEPGIVMVSEMENRVTPLLLGPQSVLFPNSPCPDRNGVIYFPDESAREAFYTCDPKEAWAPRKRSFIWKNLNGYGLPTNNWKHSMGFCELDGCIYTRFYDGQVVKIDPRTLEAEIIYMTPNGTTNGCTFHPLYPELLYIVGRQGGMSGGIFVLDVRNPEETFVRLNAFGVGHRDGDLSTALFNNPWQIYFDSDGTLYVADGGNHCIRMIRPDNIVETVVGMPGTADWKDGNKEDALFNEPRGVGVSKDGSVYVADWGNSRIRKLAIE